MDTLEDIDLFLKKDLTTVIGQAGETRYTRQLRKSVEDMAELEAVKTEETSLVEGFVKTVSSLEPLFSVKSVWAEVEEFLDVKKYAAQGDYTFESRASHYVENGGLHCLFGCRTSGFC